MKLFVLSEINQNISMKNQLKKELKKMNIDSKSLFKSPLKILKKINLDKLKKIKSFSITEKYKDFKKNNKQKEL
ncbi:hypothetical protein N9T41_02615, partial [Candidatus Pelagibacter sp.]|nr:hypothetical protein [Candidatus Pelagibacter sp.]